MPCPPLHSSLTGHALLGNLSVVDLLLHSAVTNQAIDVGWFGLPVPVHTAHSLGVVTWVPRHIQHNHTVSSNQVDT